MTAELCYTYIQGCDRLTVSLNTFDGEPARVWGTGGAVVVVVCVCVCVCGGGSGGSGGRAGVRMKRHCIVH